MTRSRRVLIWVGLAVFAIVVGSVAAVVAGSMQTGGGASGPDPDSSGAHGTRALVTVLREQGVDVIVTRDRAATSAALAEGPATLVTGDNPYLSDESMAGLFDAATDVVVIDPRTRVVELLLPGASAAGFASGEPTAPGCSFAVAERAGAVTVGRTMTAGTSGALECYANGDRAGLLALETPEGLRSVVDGTRMFANQTIIEEGNAALALGLLGRQDRLVWFVPSAADIDPARVPATLGQLTPQWVTPVIVLLVLTAGVAAFWRGRRFGPLVVERLPVTARSSETMRGRARLYERGRDHRHAADNLRMGTISRVAGLTGLGRSASVDEVSDRVADLLSRPRGDIRALLRDADPTTDAQLLDLSAALHELENATHRMLRTDTTDEGTHR